MKKEPKQEEQLDLFKHQVDGTHYKHLEYQPFQFFTKLAVNGGIALAMKYLTRLGVEKDANGIGIEKTKHCLGMFNEIIQNAVAQGEYIHLHHIDIESAIQFTNQFSPIVNTTLLNMCILQNQAERLVMVYHYLEETDPDSIEAEEAMKEYEHTYTQIMNNLSTL